MEVTYEGTDGTVGSVSRWVGNKEVGKGSQTITKIDDNKAVEMKLKFLEPWENESDAFIYLTDTTDGVKVTWGFKGDMPRPWNLMSPFMTMQKEFDTGLTRLKALSEKEAMSGATGARTFDIKETTTAPKTYIGIRKELTFDKLFTFFSENYPKLFTDLQKANVQPIGSPSGLFYTFDEKAMKTQVAAVAPVADAKKEVGSWQTFAVKGGKTVTVDYYGAYDKSKAAHDAIGEYIKKKNYKWVAPVIEEYVTDPGNEKDTAKWLTRISYFVE
jgi:effector-binding domain-containing protein